MAFLGTLAVGNTLALTLPGPLYTFALWAAVQAIGNTLGLVLAVALARRVLRLFPTARVTAHVGIVIVIVIATVISVLVARSALLPQEHSFLGAIVRVTFPILVGSATWVFTVLVIVVVYFNLPVRPFDRVVILGFLGYTLIFNAAVRVVWQVQDAGLARFAEYLDGLGWLGLMLWWLWAARRLPREKSA